MVLIDTWWNVNTKICFFQFLDEIVLIDTWWNVNISKPARYYTFDIVLIDTWWNVNECQPLLYVIRQCRFNRYMVECEYLLSNMSLDAWSSFNRYMVECEFNIGFF